ncbi:MAG: hypothetical protein PHW74_14665 [Desulfobacca sp.]|nr:hypothetical protein [Desulfobacca sp.]
MQRKSEQAMRVQRQQAIESRWHPEKKYESDTLTDPYKPKTDTRAEVARTQKIPERKLRDVAQIAKAKAAASKTNAEAVGISQQAVAKTCDSFTTTVLENQNCPSGSSS